MFDVDRAKSGAVAADVDNFIVSKLINPCDRIFQPRREVMSSLPVDTRSVGDGAAAGSKKVNIYPTRKLGAEGGKIQKWPGRIWESAARQFDSCGLGKNQNSSPQSKLRSAYC